ncbi:MAG TPA: hypothetical protein VK906_11485 [Egicoccus sp.]|nr:hypothetical protein [Egicoccus sp.]HSK23794.1 hypothetical protein [Egicoccus sp.]
MGEALARVDDADWLSTGEAGRTLGLSRWRVRLLRAAGHVQGATNAAGAVGYLRTSIEQEARWRRDASHVQRLRRVAGSLLDWTP